MKNETLKSQSIDLFWPQIHHILFVEVLSILGLVWLMNAYNFVLYKRHSVRLWSVNVIYKLLLT